MLRKVFKTGNSVVVALPREMLNALHIVEGKEVSVDLDIEHGQITIAPVAPAIDGVDADFACQVAEFIDSYRPALEALAR
jgi:antitoxin component of MazEF toxin-antitoxin module